MTKLNNKTSSPEDHAPHTPPGIMSITLLLLISALSVTAFMMLYYSEIFSDRTPKPSSPPLSSSDPNQPAQTTTQLEKVNADPASENLKSNSNQTEAEEKSGMINQLFSAKASSARWPKMKLTGFGTPADGTGGFAIINNHQYRVGQLIDDKVKLIEVRKHDIVLEMAGETKTLSVNTID